MFRCSSFSLLSGKNVTFTLQHNTQPGEVLFVSGNHPQLGNWDLSKAKRMTWNCGNIWDVKVGFSEGARVEYKYFVLNEATNQLCWEKGENRILLLVYDEITYADKWDTRSSVSLSA